jgi:hypothetical protein
MKRTSSPESPEARVASAAMDVSGIDRDAFYRGCYGVGLGAVKIGGNSPVARTRTAAWSKRSLVDKFAGSGLAHNEGSVGPSPRSVISDGFAVHIFEI